MVEHEVSVETTQVETDTVRFCDYCGSPEEQVENIETLFTVDHGPKIIREDRRGQRITTAWQPPPNPDYRESVDVPGIAGERLYVEYDVDGLAEACEACRERLGEGEIPNPGTIHRDATDPADVPDDVGYGVDGDGAYRRAIGDVWATATGDVWYFVLLWATVVSLPLWVAIDAYPVPGILGVIGALGLVHDVVTEVYGP